MNPTDGLYVITTRTGATTLAECVRGRWFTLDGGTTVVMNGSEILSWKAAA